MVIEQQELTPKVVDKPIAENKQSIEIKEEPDKEEKIPQDVSD